MLPCKGHWEAVQHAVGTAGRSLEQTMAQLTRDPPFMPPVGFVAKNLVRLLGHFVVVVFSHVVAGLG